MVVGSTDVLFIVENTYIVTYNDMSICYSSEIITTSISQLPSWIFDITWRQPTLLETEISCTVINANAIVRVTRVSGKPVTPLVLPVLWPPS